MNAKKAPGLDYFWSRKSNGICNIWEMPEMVSSKIIGAILRPERNYMPVVFVVVLELSRPNALAQIVEQILNNFENFEFTHMVLIGSKYDVFQNLGE